MVQSGQEALDSLMGCGKYSAPAGSSGTGDTAAGKAGAGNDCPRPDLIFLDINMPAMDGWEFLNEYSQLKPKLKKDIALFIVSSSISPQEVERSKTYRAVTDFLIKPVEKGKIVEIMDNVPEAG